MTGRPATGSWGMPVTPTNVFGLMSERYVLQQVHDMVRDRHQVEHVERMLQPGGRGVERQDEPRAAALAAGVAALEQRAIEHLHQRA